MECPFCCFLCDFIGQYVRIGVVTNCASDVPVFNHIYYDGFIQRRSFCNNTLRLYDDPMFGNVTFTACCDDIFEVYIFPTVTAENTEATNKIDIPTMVEQRLELLNTIKGIKKEEAEAYE